MEQVKIGTLLGHVVEHIPVELQSLVGTERDFGQTRSTNVKGIYHVIFSYGMERACKYVTKDAVALVGHLFFTD